MLKVKYGPEVHIYSLMSVQTPIQEVKDMVKKSFRAVPLHFDFIFVDGEGDEIQISTSEDLAAAFQLAKQNQMNRKAIVVKLEVREREAKEELLAQKIDNEDEKYQTLQSEQNPQTDLTDVIRLSSNNNTQTVQVLLQEESKQETDVIAEEIDSYINTVGQSAMKKVLEDIQDKLIRQEIKNYLAALNRNVEMKVTENEMKETHEVKKRRQMLRDKKRKEFDTMIRNSMQKLLPSFMENLAKQTTQAVYTLLA